MNDTLNSIPKHLTTSNPLINSMLLLDFMFDTIFIFSTSALYIQQ